MSKFSFNFLTCQTGEKEFQCKIDCAIVKTSIEYEVKGGENQQFNRAPKRLGRIWWLMFQIPKGGKGEIS